jgi:serine/threonine protein kinase
MIGQTVSHYKILEKLGEGGMGVVYRAEDVKLNRMVALKFLPPELTRDPEAKQRFIQEAQAASALDHPNICTIHDIGETGDGQLFMVMACYQGSTLKAKIEAGALAAEDAVEIALNIARGLSKAHQRNIVHRDIKPANILLTEDEEVKIADFGLAKLAGQVKLTRTGTTVGTAAYMSPEQARGEDVDLRTDIWSLGAVLYEMLTGQLPFRGEHEQAVVYSILNEAPKPASSLIPKLSPEFDRLIGKCLDKNPDERYQNADELMADLKLLKLELKGFKTSFRWQAKPPRRHPALRILGLIAVVIIFIVVIYKQYAKLSGTGDQHPADQRKKLAVLFFENLGPPEDEYFADGITDAITARLAIIPELGVISRQSTIQYKNSTKSLREIGQDLGADYILEGTIQRERPGDPASRVRIIPQLIYVKEDIHLWADTYDKSMAELFEMQSAIAELVAQAMNVTLLESVKQKIETKPTDNLEAYELYLRSKPPGRRLSSPEESIKYLDLLKRAVEIDPGFALAWSDLSIGYSWLYYVQPMASLGTPPNEDYLTRARQAADRAFELQPDLPQAYMAMGYFYYYGQSDYIRALEQFTLARDRQPNNVRIMEATAYIMRRLNRWEESNSLLEEALELDPRNFDLNFSLALNLKSMRMFEDAVIYFERSISLSPDISFSYLYFSEMYLEWQGDTDKARQLLEDCLKVVPPDKIIVASTSIMTRIFPDFFNELLEQILTSGDPLEDSLSFYFTMAELKKIQQQSQSAFEYFEQVRKVIERKDLKVESRSEYLHATLGRVYAELGLNKEAIREANIALELRPIANDPWEGPAIAIAAAEIYTIVGEFDTALDLIEQLLSIPSDLSVNLLRLDPIWDPLRDQPRFTKLVGTDS